jgi:hypothetical protein
MTRGRVVCLLASVTLLVGCAEPPNKEMNQAQGAIDAARAAGAEHYATTELTAAIDALQRSEAAVAENDYRLALNLAIDSRDRAQLAAKAAVDARAQARGDAERTVADARALLAQATERLRTASSARPPRRTLEEPRKAIAAAEQHVQEARAALDSDDYPRAIEHANSASARLQSALAALQQPPAATPVRRRS